jgi:CelD/BcsL family acetyltransferase involved in cellulose biosynthesis
MVKQISLPEAQSVWHRAFEKNDLHVPFLSYEWHALWYEVFQQKDASLILTTNETIAPLIQKNTHVYFSGGEEIADYLDILGPSQDKAHTWKSIVAFLQEKGIKQLTLRNVPESSATYSFFSTWPGAHIQKEDTTPLISLPSNWELYLETLTRKYRHELERKMRKFEREHIDATIEQSENPAVDIDIFLSLMEKDPAKQTFLTNDMKIFFKRMASTFASQISLLFLRMGDKYAATTLSFVHNNTNFLYNSGFDRACCANGGFYLKAQSIKRAIDEGMQSYNFLQGSERYKYELGGKDFGVYTVNVPIG